MKEFSSALVRLHRTLVEMAQWQSGKIIQEKEKIKFACNRYRGWKLIFKTYNLVLKCTIPSAADVTFLSVIPIYFWICMLLFKISLYQNLTNNLKIIDKLSGIEFNFFLQILFTSGILSAELVILMDCDTEIFIQGLVKIFVY